LGVARLIALINFNRGRWNRKYRAQRAGYTLDNFL
jgi:hypothetical protein